MLSFVTLDTLAAALLRFPSVKLEIQGHTDSSGKKAQNKRISQKRANAVKTYLIDRGVPKESLTAVGYGQEKPIATNDTKEGRIKNRRVEFIRTDSLQSK